MTDEEQEQKQRWVETNVRAFLAAARRSYDAKVVASMLLFERAAVEKAMRDIEEGG